MKKAGGTPSWGVEIKLGVESRYELWIIWDAKETFDGYKQIVNARQMWSVLETCPGRDIKLNISLCRVCAKSEK